jgi:hypothetical protein
MIRFSGIPEAYEMQRWLKSVVDPYNEVCASLRAKRTAAEGLHVTKVLGLRANAMAF